MLMNNVFFVSGTDTGVGKSYATGYLAREWNSRGCRTVTQKLVQTGNTDVSEDIEVHRAIMGCGFLPEDHERLTMPEIFTYPCSPHLAAEIDGRPVDFGRIDECTRILSARYDAVLLEGAGGLMVPLTRNLLTLDYAAERGYPLILVTSGRLGSINHTLLSLEAAKRHGLVLKMLMYNMYPHEDDMTISDDTEQYLKSCLESMFPDAEYMRVPLLQTGLSAG